MTRLPSLLKLADGLSQVLLGDNFQGGQSSYERELGALYEKWANKTAAELADADEDERDEIMAAALAALAASMTTLQRRGISEAMLRGLGATPPTPDLLRKMADLNDENERAILQSLSPAIRMKLQAAMMDEDVRMALDKGKSAGASALAGILAALGARVGLYGGVWWAANQLAVGTKLDIKQEPVAWIRDPQAKHCDTCWQYGDRTYDDMQALLEETGGITPAHGTLCGGNCRCELRGVDESYRVA